MQSPCRADIPELLKQRTFLLAAQYKHLVKFQSLRQIKGSYRDPLLEQAAVPVDIIYILPPFPEITVCVDRFLLRNRQDGRILIFYF